jgi:hypothetical protein
MILRLGYTESTLFLCFFLKNIINQKLNKHFEDTEKNMINWLYSTSGFYDKSIEGDYFNFNYETCVNSFIYNEYMKKVYTSIINSKKVILCFHGEKDKDDYSLSSKQKFLEFFKDKTEVVMYQTQENFFNFISEKKLLIINPISSLMKKQYDNNNCKNIYPNFPSLKSIYYYENPYTFCNNGSNNNILETNEKIFDEIKNLNYDYDSVIISCGAYSNLLANLIYMNLNKDVFVIGGNLASYFGIKTGRNKLDNHHDYCISVPEEMKPINYLKIEDGCYW